MDKFISAEEYLKIKEKQTEITNEITQNMSMSEQFELAMSMMSGDKNSIMESLGKIFDKVYENEQFQEIQAQLKGAIIEQDISLETFEKTLSSFETMDEAKQNASNEEIEMYNGLMSFLQEKVSFGESNMNELAANFLLAKGLLDETNSSFEGLKTYTKDSDMVSMQLTSIEQDSGKKHEFTIVFEEDKIYHKITNLDGSFVQDEDYVSDKKKEFNLENFDGMSI